MLSKRKSREYKDIRDYRFIGGFAIWPSHRGGINFRKLRYNDDIYRTLDDITGFYSAIEKNEYIGVVGAKDYEWFNYVKLKGTFEDTFFFDGYNEYRGQLLEFEKERTNKILEYL